MRAPLLAVERLRQSLVQRVPEALVKLTAGLSALFFITSLTLAVIAKQKADAAGAFGLPDLPAQDVESVIQEPVTPKTVD